MVRHMSGDRLTGCHVQMVAFIRRLSLLGLAMSILGFCQQALAENPIASHIYTADPAARVINGRVYVIMTHDQDDQTDYSKLVDYALFSSDDMVNWQDHGIVWNSRTNTIWAKGAFAPDFVERNGKFYLYFPDGGNAIGVAVADRPEGPYADPLGRPLIDRRTPNANVQFVFDPAVFIDDDGQAYLYFGGGAEGMARVIRLNNDMISTSGPAVTLDVPNFFEALYMHKRNGTYYLSYSTGSSTGLRIDYMTSRKPVTGFSYRGTVLPNPWANNNNNNHQSIVDFKGQSYVFYHNRVISNERGGNTFQRSVNVDRLLYNTDGSIQRVIAGRAGVPQVKNVDASAVLQAETFDVESGIETERASEGTLDVRSDPGDFLKVSRVDFGAGAAVFRARVATELDSRIEIILDSKSNAPIASLPISRTRGYQAHETQSVAIPRVTGVHDVFLRSAGYHNLNWFQFASASQSDIVIRASGTSGTEHINLSIGGSVVADFNLTTSLRDYVYRGPASGDLLVQFDNDAAGRDVILDFVFVNNEIRQAEDQTFNTATFAAGRCGGGGRSEQMNCNGAIGFGSTSACSTGNCTTRTPPPAPQVPARPPVQPAPIPTRPVVPPPPAQGPPRPPVQSPVQPAPPETMSPSPRPKFVGNITTRERVRSDFRDFGRGFWNQITPENAGKWGSVEPVRDRMNWTSLDQVYQYAKANGIPFKLHTLVWGSQQPPWIGGLPRNEQREEVEEWIRLACERYPDTALVDVVNEPPPHTFPVYADALGGAGRSGYDWIVESFRLARKYCPKAVLILNDYNNIEYGDQIRNFIDITNRVRAAGAPIDAVGAQAHDAYRIPASTLKQNIDMLVTATGLPVYITEYDINLASDSQQADVMRAQFPIFYTHPRVAGITLWGYIIGQTWLPNTGLLSPDGTVERPALTWLLDYLDR